LKVGLAHLARGDHGLAHEYFARAWALLDLDAWYRWRWHIPLLRARGALALAEGRHDEAWRFATESLAMATASDSRKHVARAQRLRGEVLAATAKLVEAAQTLAGSVGLAETIGALPEVWIGEAALGRVLASLGRDPEARLARAADTVELIAAKLETRRLRQSFLGSAPILEVYQALGRRPRVGAGPPRTTHREIQPGGRRDTNC
jgi:tetratricopeptide (TPR) repeat protein